MSSWFASALFYAGWWIISSYFSAGSVRLNLPRLTVLVLSLSAFALLYALGILLPAVWSWLTAPPVPTGVKTTTT